MKEAGVRYDPTIEIDPKKLNVLGIGDFANALLRNQMPFERGYITLLGRLSRGNTDFHSFYMFRNMDKLKPCKLKESNPWWTTGTWLELSQLCEVVKALQTPADNAA